MADAIFITHVILLLTLRLCSGEQEIALQEQDISFDDEKSDSPEPLDPNFGFNTNGQKRFKCHICEDFECVQSNVCNNAITCWKSRVREVNGKEYVSRGCYKSEEHKLMMCNKENSQNNIEHKKRNVRGLSGGVQYSVECCQADFCNVGPYPKLEDSTNTNKEYHVIRLTFVILGLLSGMLIFGGIALCLFIHRVRRKRPTVPRRNKLILDSEIEPSMLHFSFSSPTSSATYHSHELRATAAGDSILKEYLDGRSLTSGSGSGLPLLVQRTLAKQVALVECLGSGSSGGFGGEVWRGVWHGENVAVKIYFSRDEAAWARETEVYSQLLPSRHDNILGYIGSDMTSRASCTQLWLVVQYHPLGSLFDHLNRSPHPLTPHQTLNICLSIANGLLYLHTEIHGTKGKPAMAHRNLKSKNILVKTNGGCVIADFALAATQDRLIADRVDLRQGTKRYMSPEILEQTVNVECLESFKRADIYSLGLILWEVCRRCISNGVALEYAMPYSEWLPNSNQEPSIEEMRKLVSFDQRRPSLPNRSHSDPTLAGMGKLMRECWHGKPAARLPILRVKKTLVKLAASDSRVHLPLD
ncbi:PREDICTED: activin receptor type-1-like [Cyphomyrmex costatus]|uniref:receptor protein serine/threonine kinase n=1 Tax=Cyphomyrmex costatus TaxID=456900 RepID=A0A151IMZ6_9HYME|nr:PREDICTED: activin receptor type-1-like [Cyphomyrmex costatus]KYN06312.1 Activin receptor type-1 [Cyphomyrmex costatus]